MSGGFVPVWLSKDAATLLKKTMNGVFKPSEHPYLVGKFT